MRPASIFLGGEEGGRRASSKGQPGILRIHGYLPCPSTCVLGSGGFAAESLEKLWFCSVQDDSFLGDTQVLETKIERDLMDIIIISAQRREDGKKRTREREREEIQSVRHFGYRRCRTSRACHD